MERHFHDRDMDLDQQFQRKEAARKASMTQEEWNAEWEQLHQEAVSFLKSYQTGPRPCPVPELLLRTHYHCVVNLSENLADHCGLNLKLERNGTWANLNMEGSMLLISRGAIQTEFLRLAELAERVSIQAEDKMIHIFMSFDLSRM